MWLGNLQHGVGCSARLDADWAIHMEGTIERGGAQLAAPWWEATNGLVGHTVLQPVSTFALVAAA